MVLELKKESSVTKARLQTSLSLPADVSAEERRFDPVHTDEQSIPPAEAHVHVGTFPEP